MKSFKNDFAWFIDECITYRTVSDYDPVALFIPDLNDDERGRFMKETLPQIANITYLDNCPFGDVDDCIVINTNHSDSESMDYEWPIFPYLRIFVIKNLPDLSKINSTSIREACWRGVLYIFYSKDVKGIKQFNGHDACLVSEDDYDVPSNPMEYVITTYPFVMGHEWLPKLLKRSDLVCKYIKNNHGRFD